jgi:hypothetical protein
MEDKYMRAARAVEKYTDGGWDIACIAKTIKAEIERPEPLLPGVRYRNTEANRKRIPVRNCLVYANVFWKFPAVPCLAAYHKGEWYKEGDGLSRPLIDLDAFALIPDGEVQDE